MKGRHLELADSVADPGRITTSREEGSQRERLTQAMAPPGHEASGHRRRPGKLLGGRRIPFEPRGAATEPIEKRSHRRVREKPEGQTDSGQ